MIPTHATVEDRRELTREQRRQVFMRAGEYLFGEKGYNATTMEDIARRAEFATGTIYRYFNSKEELYSQILNNKLDELFKLIEEKDDPTLPARERLRHYIMARFTFCRTHQSFLQIYTNEVLSPTAQLTAKLNTSSLEKHQKCVQRLTRIFQDGVKSGEFKPNPPALYVTGLYGFMNEIFLQNFRSEQPVDINTLENFAIEMIEGAVLKQ